jgi:hypothetical protein
MKVNTEVESREIGKTCAFSQFRRFRYTFGYLCPFKGTQRPSFWGSATACAAGSKRQNPIVLAPLDKLGSLVFLSFVTACSGGFVGMTVFFFLEQTHQ